jgi:hypothetical protein
MPNQMPGYIRKGGLLSALIAAMFAPHAFAVPAGRVDFSIGKVSATGPDGVARDLIKGAEINTGDSISTGTGRLQIRFTDGAYMSLQPNTVFKVENYKFNGKADGEEKGVFNLLTGGLRTISGLIGKGKRENYELRTKTATIGIRGTAYSARQTDDTLIVSVGEGRISVSNQSGNLTIGSGQSAIVRGPQSSPEMSDDKALAPDSPLPQGPVDPQNAAEQRNPNGSSAALGSGVLTTGPGYGISYGIANPAAALGFHSVPSSGVFSGTGALQSISDGANSLDFSGGTLQSSGSDSLIGWGHWSGVVGGTMSGTGTYTPPEGIHYVTGIPTPSGSSIFTSNNVVVYSMIGSTVPTSYNGTVTSSASVSAGNATVQFIPGSIQMTLNFSVTSGATYNLASFGALAVTPVGAGTSMFLTSAVNTSAGVCGGSQCTLTTKGLFTGANAERLGIAYTMVDNNFSGPQITGAAAFKAP